MTLEEVESKLTAIAKLPEKWRKNRAEPWELIQDLEAALGSLPMEPVPEVPADPLPAGKLSDEQLGVIGLRAANSCNHQVKFYENFARAVREAVEKECNRSMQNGLYQAIVNKLKPILGENSRELEWDILPFTLGKLIAAKRIPDAGQAKKIGEQAEEIARLTAKSEKMCQAFVAEAAKKHEALAIIEQAIEMVNTLGTTKDNLPNAINAKIMQRDEFHDATLKKLDAANTEIARLTAELSNATKEWHAERDRADEKIRQWVEANAELERLRWRPIATAPNDGQWILTWRAIGAGGDPEVKQARWYPDRENFGGHGWTFPQWGNAMPSHWRPLCPPPSPTAEEVERERFEIWAATSSFGHDLTRTPCGKHYNSVLTCEAWELWQAARAAKEVEK